jgi:hypothetical protein
VPVARHLAAVPLLAVTAIASLLGTVDIAQLIKGVNNSLTDCESVP